MAKCTGILISSAWYRDPVDPVIDGSSFRSRTIRGLPLAYPFLLFLSLSAPCIASSLVQIVGASSLASNRRFIFLILLFLSSLFFFIFQIFREEIIRVNRSMG